MAEFMSFLKIFKVDYARVSVEAMIEKYRIFGINPFFFFLAGSGLSAPLGCHTNCVRHAPPPQPRSEYLEGLTA